MKYIPDKTLYSAVMLALNMCPSLRLAKDSKIKVAANYYHVDYADVLAIVREELWNRAIKEAKQTPSEWYTILNGSANDLLGVGYFNDYIFICPHCGRHYSCNINDNYKINKIFTSQCICGFADEWQKEYRK